MLSFMVINKACIKPGIIPYLQEFAIVIPAKEEVAYYYDSEHNANLRTSSRHALVL